MTPLHDPLLEMAFKYIDTKLHALDVEAAEFEAKLADVNRQRAWLIAQKGELLEQATAARKTIPDGPHWRRFQ